MENNGTVMINCPCFFIDQDDPIEHEKAREQAVRVFEQAVQQEMIMLRLHKHLGSRLPK